MVLVNLWWWWWIGDGNTLSASRSERLECSLVYQAEPQGQMFFLHKIPPSPFYENGNMMMAFGIQFSLFKKNCTLYLFAVNLWICELYMRKKRKMTDEEAFFKGTSVWWNTIKRMHKKKNYEVVFCKNSNLANIEYMKIEMARCKDLSL